MGIEKTVKQSGMIKGKEDIPTRPLWQRLLAVGLIIIIFVIGISIAKYLINNKPQTKKRAPKKTVTVVQTIPLARSDSFIKVSGVGTVTPAKTINLQAQVSGIATYVNSKLIPGGIIKKGETIIKIEDHDYKIQQTLKESMLNKALADLAIEQGQQAIAADEWKLIQEFSKNKDSQSTTALGAASDLVLRKPHLEKIKASVASARAELDQARLNIQRTSVKAPFNAIVSEKNIAQGSLISTQTAIAKLVGIDEYWVEILIPAGKLPYINISSNNNLNELPKVKISYTGNNNSIEYQGKILKLLSQVDSKGLMANILISVTDPLGFKNSHFPLLLGSSVKAEIRGRQLKGYFKIPRDAVLDNGRILLAKDNNTLEIRDIVIAWKSKEWVYIKDGLKVNENLIISPVPAPINGMPIKIIPLKNRQDQ